MRFSPTYSILRKELRALGGLWIAMIMLCAVVQMSLLMVSEFQVTRIHDLTAALFGASLILAAAYAAGSTGVLFAMEHEAGTFGLLRRLPISPRRIFFSKLLWPALSLLAFWAVAWPLSRLFASSFPSVPRTGMLWALWGVGAVETFAWGTFFSLRSRRPLVAAFLGLTVTGLSAYLATILYIRLFGNPSGTVVGAYAVAWPMRLLFALAVGAVDFALGLRWFDMSKTLETEPSAGARSGGAWGERWQPRLFGRTRTFFSLVWQHWRQTRGLVGCLALGFVPLAVYAFTSTYGSDPQFWMTIVILIAIATFPIGASLLFMPDQRRRSYRFLAHHGASPSTVWWSRQTLGAILATVGTVAYFFLLFTLIHFEHRRNTPELLEPRGAIILLGTILIAYAGGQFVSLVLRSPIIAGVVGCAVTCVLLAWTVLTQTYLVPREWMFEGLKNPRKFHVFIQSAEAFVLVVAPILIALILASRLHVKDWLSDHVSRRSHLRWVGILGVSFVIVYACLPIMRFANAPAYTDPGFSVMEFERAQEDPRVHKAQELAEELARRLTHKNPDYDDAFVNELIAFGKGGRLPATLTWPDDHKLYAEMARFYDALWEADRRLEAIAFLRTWHTLWTYSRHSPEYIENAVFARLYSIAHQDDLGKEELEAAIELVQSLTPDSINRTDAPKRDYVHLRKTLGVPDKEIPCPRWPRELVLILAPWEESVYLRFLNARSRTALEERRQYEKEGGELDSARGPVFDQFYDRRWYWDAAAEYATFGTNFFGRDDLWSVFFHGNTERTRRAVLILLVLRRWQLEHDGRLPESLDAVICEALPVIPLDPWSGQNNEPPKTFTLNRNGRPFAFEVRQNGVDVDVIPAQTPYLTPDDDALDQLAAEKEDRSKDGDSPLRTGWSFCAWPVWTPEE